jgi:pyruvate/2-oxoglutarate/acetoin dehydrogenase E1 component|tara:strand:+ start:214 stop:747 length:534 start_codon:yes stop_codon:yes gene_type:complete
MYFQALSDAMTWLAEQGDTVFLGQAVEVPGTAMSNTLQQVDKAKLIEMPVAEEMQMGVSIGLAMAGTVPVSIFPRWNFLLLAVNQLVNHLDRMPKISNGGFSPKVIIRTSVGAERPLHPQHQHVGDFTDPFKAMLENIEVIRLQESEQIVNSYKRAYEREDGRSTILVEYGDYYNEK